MTNNENTVVHNNSLLKICYCSLSTKLRLAYEFSAKKAKMNFKLLYLFILQVKPV